MLDGIFFSGWKPIIHTLIVAIVAYPAMLLMVRLSGHRTLAKMNAFDLVVTVALGSTLASAITSRDVALAQGLLAFVLLIGLQYVVAWLARQSPTLEHVVNGEPILLFHQGAFLRRAMRDARLTESELLAAMRSAGAGSENEVASVVLETNGQLSVVQKRGDERVRRGGEGMTLRSVERPRPA